MKNLKSTTLEDFYEQTSPHSGKGVNHLLPPDIHKEIGHFNVFDIAETIDNVQKTAVMPYNRRAYYKISLVDGRNRVEYADKIIENDRNTFLFATPKLPYHWLPLDVDLTGTFCIFNAAFLVKNKTGFSLDDFPIFKPGAYPVFQVSEADKKEIQVIFEKMKQEIDSDYAYKYDLLRGYVLELIHIGQKLQPTTSLYHANNASDRVASLFIELLERQFPIESPNQRILLRSASDYAKRLAIHVNHLNKVLKDSTGKTTTEIIKDRLLQESKILLKQTEWNISEIAFCLGFEEVAHFSNFFKKITSFSPLHFRS